MYSWPDLFQLLFAFDSLIVNALDRASDENWSFKKIYSFTYYFYVVIFSSNSTFSFVFSFDLFTSMLESMLAYYYYYSENKSNNSRNLIIMTKEKYQLQHIRSTKWSVVVFVISVSIVVFILLLLLSNFFFDYFSFDFDFSLEESIIKPR